MKCVVEQVRLDIWKKIQTLFYWHKIKIKQWFGRIGAYNTTGKEFGLHTADLSSSPRTT